MNQEELELQKLKELLSKERKEKKKLQRQLKNKEKNEIKANELAKLVVQSDMEQSFMTSLSHRSITLMRKVRTDNLPLCINDKAHPQYHELRAMPFIPDTDSNFVYHIYNYQNKISTNARIFLEILRISYLKNMTDASGTIVLPLTMFMEWRGLKSERNAREQVNKAIEELKTIRFSWESTEKSSNRGDTNDYLDIFIFGGFCGLKGGKIYFNFSNKYIELLENAGQYIEIPRTTFDVNLQHFPHLFDFLMAISENYRINERFPKRLPTISIKALLDNTPTLPTWDMVKAENSDFYNQIILPTIKTLEELKGRGIIDYRFHPPRQYLVENAYPNPNSDFRGKKGNELFHNSMLRLDYSKYPAHTKRTAKALEHRANAMERVVKRDKNIVPKI